MSEVANSMDIKIADKQVNRFYSFIKNIFNRWIVILGFLIIFVFVVVALFAPIIAPYDPYEVNFAERLQQPSIRHPLGCDDLGRDTLSRMIYGSRISLFVGIMAVIIAGAVGMTMGMMAGYFGGLLDSIIMRFIDAIMSFPTLILMLTIAVTLGGGLKNLLIAIGIGMMPTYCRLMRGQIVSLKESEFITAVRIIGANKLRIMFRHLLPNSFPSLLVLLTMNLGHAIMTEAMLSFLGIGITAPTATWGSMVNMGYRHLLTYPILSLTPGIAIMMVVLAFNIVGDGLRDSLDPRLRGTL